MPRRCCCGGGTWSWTAATGARWTCRLPAYITPEQYEANVARMAANRQTAATPGAPRHGSALLSGLLRCGRCGGHRMTVRYHDGSHAGHAAHGYACAFYQVNYG